MLIVMRKSATHEQIDRVLEAARAKGLTPVSIPGAQRTAVGLTGNQGAIDPLPFQKPEGVRECIRVSRPYNLVSRETKPEDTVVTVHEPDKALSDGPKSLLPQDFEKLARAAQAIHRTQKAQTT